SDGACKLRHRCPPATRTAVAGSIEGRDSQAGIQQRTGQGDEPPGMTPPTVTAEHGWRGLRTPLVDLDPATNRLEGGAASLAEPFALVGPRDRAAGPHEERLGQRRRSGGGHQLEGAHDPAGTTIPLIH